MSFVKSIEIEFDNLVPYSYPLSHICKQKYCEINKKKYLPACVGCTVCFFVLSNGNSFFLLFKGLQFLFTIAKFQMVFILLAFLTRIQAEWNDFKQAPKKFHYTWCVVNNNNTRNKLACCCQAFNLTKATHSRIVLIPQ